MSTHSKDTKSKLWQRLGAYFSSSHKEEEAQARIQAFLSAFPGEYCGWDKDGQAAYSSGFCKILGIERVKSLSDVQSKLAPSDSAALEGVFEHLEEKGQSFEIYVHTYESGKILKVTGSQGRDPDGREKYNVIWIEDVTDERQAYERLEEDKLEQEKRNRWFEIAFNSIMSPRWLRAKNGELIWVNKGYSNLVGYTPREVIKRQSELAGASRKKGKDKEKVLLGPELAEEALQKGKAQSSQVHVNSGGQRLLMKITEIPMDDYDMTLGVAEDISAEEQIHTELKRHQASNLELLEQLHSAIAIYSDDQRLEFYNSSFAQLWGLEGGWLNTKPPLGDVMEKLRETRRLPEQADFRSFKKSWLDMFTTLIGPHDDMLYLPDGSALRMLVIPHSMGGLMMNFEDVTSRLELESSYNTLIAVQKETLDNLGEAVAVYGGDGRLKLCNPAFGRLWNLHPEDLEGEPHINTIVEKLKSFFGEDDWPRRREELISKTLDRVMHEGRFSCLNDVNIDYSTVPLPDGGVLITYSDVTDSVRVENALREKNAALEAAERLKLDFLANVSYQLRTPLNAIMGFNEILEQEFYGPLNEKQHEYTRDMGTASEKLLYLVDDILDLATLEAGYMDMQMEDVSVYQLMNSVEELVIDWARKGDVRMRLKCPKNIGKVNVDRKRIKQAIINVIRNAINFTPSGGLIDLSAKRIKNGVLITVQDNGVGMHREERERVFEPFERAHKGPHEVRSPRGGAGLGLSLVKNIVSAHNGEVTIESELGRGTKVILFLPFTSMPSALKFDDDNKASA
tara:strand:- start:3520 stop:5901 length:2382 start_codon:yes stop_codon:yes gene_type:complete